MLYQILSFITHGKTKSLYNNNKFKISPPTWNDEFELPDGSYSVSDIQEYFEYILKNTEKILINHQYRYMEIKLKIGLHLKLKMDSLELLTPETMKLLGSTKNKITKDKHGEIVLHLEITEVVLIHCNVVNNDYQHNSRVLYKFVPNKQFGSLLEISPTNNIFLKTFNSE